MDSSTMIIILFQICNLLVSSFSPIIANFSQSVTTSKCWGCSINRNPRFNKSQVDLKKNENEFKLKEELVEFEEKIEKMIEEKKEDV